MVSRLFLGYAVVELAAIFALVSTLGWGWALLILLGTFVLGWGVLAPMAGSQLIRQLGRMRSGLNEPRSTLGDGAMVTVAMALVLVPGLVTTALGLLLLVTPIRAVAGPRLTTIALRGFHGRVPVITYTTAFTDSGRGHSGDGRDYIDGEVIDVTDFAPPALPKHPVGDEPPRPPGS
jgi:UPF0716 protein FxsA